MTNPLPSQARVVVVGGGVVGCSVAYHLTKLGWRDVVLVEQGRLTAGTTWHAAGLVGQMRPNRTMTTMSRYGIELYAGLEKETGLATGWKQCGSVNVAATPERLIALKRNFANAASFGVEAEFITPSEAGKLWPLMRTDDLTGAVWIPGDGKANPTDLTQSLAKGARNGGARLVEGVKVTGFDISHGRVVGVRTAEGNIACEYVVARARPPRRGQRAALLGRAFLHRHEKDRRRDARPACHARSRWFHLLQGGGRRPPDGRLRAGRQAVGDGRHTGEFRVPAAG